MLHRTQIAGLALTLAGGAYLIALSLPQLAGGVHLISQERTLDNLAGGNYTRPLTGPELAADVAMWGEAAPLVDDSDTWTGYGDVLLAEAGITEATEAKHGELLAAAHGAYRKALTLGPANSRAWTMLALTDFDNGASVAPLVPLLEMSLKTGPREAGLAFPRLDIGLYFWRQLDPKLRAALQEQALIAANYSPRRLAELVHRHYQLGVARALLSVDPILKWRFDDIYSRLFP